MNMLQGGAEEDAHAEPETIFAALSKLSGPIFTSGVCEVAAGVVGPTRAKPLNVDQEAVALVLTQTASVGDRAAYLAKCIVSSSAGRLKVIQSGAPA